MKKLNYNKINNILEDIGLGFLVYPISVVIFKLFIMPLKMSTTIFIISLCLIANRLSQKRKIYGLLISVGIYLYIRGLGLLKIISVPLYLDEYGHMISSLYRGLSISILEILESSLLGEYYFKSIAYIILINLVYAFIALLGTSFSKRYPIIPRLLPMLIFVYAWFNYIDVDLQMSLYLIGLLIISSSHNRIIHLASLIIILLIFLNLAKTLLPHDFINNRLSSIAPRTMVLRSDYKDHRSYFEFETSLYYPDEDKLGGSVSIESNRILMSVISSEDLIYLRGRVKDIYTGRSWKSSSDEYRDFQAIKRYDERLLSSRDLASALISFEDLESLTLFAPMGAIDFSISSSRIRVDKNESYYYKKPLFEENISTYRVIFTKRGDRLINDTISREEYLYLPDSISQRTKDLALSMEGKNEIETVEKIKAYLTRNYEYSLKIDGDNNYDDFVDEFLFEEKKGYCTYFASSLAIMLRINQIPTRYVEGYIVSPDSYDGEKYLIREDKAHAWVEVYLPGTGWTIVDSTPAYAFSVSEIEAVRQLKEESKNKLEGSTEKDDYEVEDIDPITDKQDPSINPMMIFVIGLMVFLVLFYLGLNIMRANRLSDREKALDLIYKIDRLLDKNLKIENNKTYTVYHKMSLYNDIIIGDFNEGIYKELDLYDFIKNVELILYTKRQINTEDLIRLKKYMKIIKKKHV